MKEVVLYGRSVSPCAFCDTAKKALEEADIEYTYKCVETSDENMEEYAKFRMRTVPLVIVDGVNCGGADTIQNTITVILAEDKPLRVRKRDGRLEELDISKIDTVLDFMADGLDKVSVSQVAMKSHIQFFDGMETDTIHSTLVKAAADLISLEVPQYSKMAARGLIFQLRKKAYGKYTPPTLLSHTKNLITTGKYDAHILEDYSEVDFALLETKLVHDRDLSFDYAAVKQLEGKYLVQNRVTGEVYESAQMLYMLVAMCLFSKYPEDTRLNYVVDFYEAISTFKISLPTPIMAGVRTPTRQFSSCVLIECGDSLDSINATSGAIVKYVSQRAGIGVNAGRIRALGSSIRGGEAEHTGCIPFFKHFQTAVKSCSQGGVRGGAASLFYPLWHMEVESLLVLKNNRGVEDNRVRHLDYAVQMNKLMYQRLIKNQDITLFSPDAVDGLYDAFFEDQELFEKLYVEAEADPTIRKKTIKAVELFTLFAQERAQTGRIYLQNVDHCNTNSPFDPSKAAIRQSNLCLEIALPTKPLQDVQDPDGEVALCTLSAFNLGEIKDIAELERLSVLAVRALDALLDYQDYPLLSAKNSTMDRRPLGIGIINYANWLAKQKLNYSSGNANNATHKLLESMQFYLMKASMELAKEKGRCPKFDETVMAAGVMPIDRYKREVDSIHTEDLHQDWSWLREEILKYGVRNSTVSCMMPSETSSQISNATNGIEAPRGLLSIKASKDGTLAQIVPDYEELKDDYELLWNRPDNQGYLELVAIMQKFVDQTISANTNYDPKRFEGGMVPVKQILKDILTAYKLGVKTMYYHNTRDGATDEVEIEDEGCAGGGCRI